MRKSESSDPAKWAVFWVMLFDAEAKKQVTARAIEPLCILWCIPGFLRNQWTHAFKLLKH